MGVVVDHSAASCNAGDATPHRSLLDKLDPPLEEDGASQRRDAHKVGEFPSRTKVRVPLSFGSPGVQELEQVLPPNQSTLVPIPGVRFGGDATGLSLSPQSTYPDPPGVVG